MSKPQPGVLFIVASRLPPEDLEDLAPGEEVIKTHLGRAYLGYHVLVMGDDTASALDARDKDLVVISSSVQKVERVVKEFRNAAVPVIVSSKELYVGLGMCNDEGAGTAKEQIEVEIVASNHPMMAGKTGIVRISSEPINISCAKTLATDAVKIAALNETTVEGIPPSVVLFGCRCGAPMFKQKKKEGAEEEAFPSRRVGFPFDYEIAEPSELRNEMWLLFEAAVNWAVGKINTRQFDEVFKEEWQEIHRRRTGPYGKDTEKNVTGFDGKHAPENLVGLALSGGGIRSATFCLGVLQGLNELNLLRIFDYLSTVSGGGYLGGWWSAWLSRDGKDQDLKIFPKPEEIEPERIDDYRTRSGHARVAEGSLSAGRDPVHHLRLFSNYLTPRKGSFSADSWRAITVLTRNLLLTQLMLLPLLFASVIAAQSLFMIYPKADFFNPYWFKLQSTVQQRAQTASLITEEKELQKFNKETEGILEQLSSDYRPALRQRALLIAGLLIPLGGWIALMFMAFMRSNAAVPLMVKAKDWLLAGDKETVNWSFPGSAVAHVLGGLGVGVIAFFVLLLAWPPISSTVKEWFFRATGRLDHQWAAWKWGLIAWAIVGSGLLLFTMPWRRLGEGAGDARTEEELRRDVWRNRISRTHGQLLVTFVLLAIVLVFAAYGHEMFDYLWHDAAPRSLFLGYVAKIGGWGAFAGAIFGTIFSALKSAPTGGHDSGDLKQSPAWHKAIFAVTPLLVMITLMVMAAWAAHEISRALVLPPEHPWPLSAIILVGVFLALFFALFEVPWNTSWLHLLFLAGFSFLVVGAAVFFYFFWLPKGFSHSGHVTLLRFAAVAGGVLFIRLGLKGDRWRGGPGRFSKKPSEKSKSEMTPQAGARRVTIAVLGLAGILLTGGGWLLAGMIGPTVSERAALTLSAFVGIALCLFYVLIEAVFGKGDNRRSLALLASVYVVSLMLMLISFQSAAATRVQYVSLGLFAATVTWVIAFGWMADPNAISMHGFYKSRLVRAYLGASNPKRLEKIYEITETVVGDDVLLSDMKNCQRGAPYHLLNTTLNLTGGRDLATAQRSSAMFVLSKFYCGSFRTGFQRTTGYTNGRLSLGTAVATSGAAVSPGMGAGKTTASQAMLMTLLNLRLGFWAPTPSGEHWESPQARLWPFYTVREFLSQTNDLSSYCYLTDGGHFDNLGLYSLVERGCRYIVVVDAVADPQPCFSDLGNAIRRCRIDFNAEIDLDITPFVKSKDDAFAKQHYAVGQIVYSETHARKLGWKDPDLPARRIGMIVYIKSSLLKNEKELRADVRQYGIENSEFPQQSTADQWFDEAQFESYRELGKHSALNVFNKIKKDPGKRKREELTKRKEPPTGNLTHKEQILLGELEAESKMLAALDGGALSPDLIKHLFDFTKRNRS